MYDKQRLVFFNSTEEKCRLYKEIDQELRISGSPENPHIAEENPVKILANYSSD